MKQNINKTLLLKKLFFSTLYLALLHSVVDNVTVSQMKTKFVDNLHWIDENEMLGIDCNCPIISWCSCCQWSYCDRIQIMWRSRCDFFQYPGAIIPPFFVISIISGFYTLFQENTAVLALLNGMRAGVGAVIVSVVWDMGSGIIRQKKAGPILIMLCAFIANYYLKINVVFIILICIAFAIIKAIITKQEAKH